MKHWRAEEAKKIAPAFLAAGWRFHGGLDWLEFAKVIPGHAPGGGELRLGFCDDFYFASLNENAERAECGESLLQFHGPEGWEASGGGWENALEALAFLEAAGF